MITLPTSGETLIVVSNRLPYTFPRGDRPAPPKRNIGGLVNAMEPVLAARNGAWIGWDGISLPSSGAVSSSLLRPRGMRTAEGIEILGVPLSEREVQRYYHGLSNRTLWPLFHNVPDKAGFAREDYEAYSRVNRRFAEMIVAQAGARDRVWVHDYHLMLVPAWLRRLGFHGRVDFFLHIPFPAPEIFLTLPWRRELIEGVLAADTAAFHVESYRSNFLRTAEAVTRARVHGIGPNPIVVESRSRGTVTAVAPIGVDSDEYAKIANSPAVAEKVRRIGRSLQHRKILFSADRLDYTKGIRERLLALERFLERTPSARGSLTMVQVVVPSRNKVDAYHQLKREIDEEVGRINGQYGMEGWVPIHYRYGALGREELVAHYRAAHAALVTPLRDGLNLVAPEFVASRTDHDGVLVLSEFAGVAEHLRDAVRVNPHDIDACADAIRQALEMDEPERRARMIRMRQQVRANPLAEWAERCLSLGTAAEVRGALPVSHRTRARAVAAGL